MFNLCMNAFIGAIDGTLWTSAEYLTSDKEELPLSQASTDQDKEEHTQIPKEYRKLIVLHKTIPNYRDKLNVFVKIKLT